MRKKFYGHGKLMLTGEYVVLDGAKSLAVPCKKGQWLEIEASKHDGLYWESLDEQGKPWFWASIGTDLEILETSDKGIAEKLVLLLSEARTLNPDFGAELQSVSATTRLEFNRNWGLGSSSTVVYAVAQWAKVNPLTLSANSFGGSGYDVACAGANGPIDYQIIDGMGCAKDVDFDPPFKDNLHFVWLGQKQLSSREIGRYNDLQFDREATANKISILTEKVRQADTLEEFMELMEQHETILSDVLQTPTIKQLLFPEIKGLLTSLGAWGGDFILHAGSKNDLNIIKAKGFDTIIPWRDMVL